MKGKRPHPEIKSTCMIGEGTKAYHGPHFIRTKIDGDDTCTKCRNGNRVITRCRTSATCQHCDRCRRCEGGTTVLKKPTAKEFAMAPSLPDIESALPDIEAFTKTSLCRAK